MAETKVIKLIRTESGDLPIDYNALANKPNIPTVVNTLTAVNAGSALDAVQGKALKGLVDAKIATSSIADNLTTNDATKVLSAKQGKALNDTKIATSAIADNLTTDDATKVLSAKQGKALNDTKVATSAIVDNLTTSDATKVLSAKQGKALKTEVDTKISASAKSVSLNVAGWTGDKAPYSRVLSLGMVTADNIIIVSPAYDSQEMFYTCGVGAKTQAAGTLTIEAQEKPSEAIVINILAIDNATVIA